jgi:ABC-type Zn2+ transport system substrate-binding protein/surface adhesin
LLDEEHEGHAEEKTGEHAHEEKEGHDHAEHVGDHADEGQHEQEGKGETHSDIRAAYHFECDAPAKLTQLTVELFEVFPGMEELKVQYVIESKQGAAELTPTDQVLTF